MKPGDRINLKDGRVAIVNRCGMSDFIGDPYPIYCQILGTTETLVLMSNELRKSK